MSCVVTQPHLAHIHIGGHIPLKAMLQWIAASACAPRPRKGSQSPAGVAAAASAATIAPVAAAAEGPAVATSSSSSSTTSLSSSETKTLSPSSSPSIGRNGVLGRGIIYYPFKDPKAAGLIEVVTLLRRKGVTIGALWRAILECYNGADHATGGRRNLFDFLTRLVTSTCSVRHSSTSIV
jgi:hypothetical protein